MEMVVLMGVQASGKTSFYQRNFACTHLHISKDLWKHNKAYKQRNLLQKALAEGQDVLIDNTHPTRLSRQEVLEAGRKAGAHIIGYCFQARLQDCLERNRQRERVVPEIGLRATYSQFEWPSLQEGFDQLYFVSLKDQDFEVSPWQDPSMTRD